LPRAGQRNLGSAPAVAVTRKGIAEWLVERLAEDVPTLVGIRTVMSHSKAVPA
jgi:hypothetical protein